MTSKTPKPAHVRLLTAHARLLVASVGTLVCGVRDSVQRAYCRESSTRSTRFAALRHRLLTSVGLLAFSPRQSCGHPLRHPFREYLQYEQKVFLRVNHLTCEMWLGASSFVQIGFCLVSGLRARRCKSIVNWRDRCTYRRRRKRGALN